MTVGSEDRRRARRPQEPETLGNRLSPRAPGREAAAGTRAVAQRTILDFCLRSPERANKGCERLCLRSFLTAAAGH